MYPDLSLPSGQHQLCLNLLSNLSKESPVLPISYSRVVCSTLHLCFCSCMEVPSNGEKNRILKTNFLAYPSAEKLNLLLLLNTSYVQHVYLQDPAQESIEN